MPLIFFKNLNFFLNSMFVAILKMYDQIKFGTKNKECLKQNYFDSFATTLDLFRLNIGSV